MGTDWFKPRRYKHFDRPVCEAFARKVTHPKFVERHAFTPLIHYLKQTKKYKKEKGKAETKNRPIMYASHRDACILSYYSFLLNENLNRYYRDKQLDEHIIAYRSPGKSNYDYSSIAFTYACQHAPCAILAFDVSGFFDNLDYRLLKNRLKRILNVASLPKDWYCVFRFVTNYHYVELAELKANAAFAEAIGAPGTGPIATVAELKAARIRFHKNTNARFGIPQGTPISASLSNLYMIEFDVTAREYCEAIGALYRRYSDDILIICPLDKATEVEAKISSMIESEKLRISEQKTERSEFALGSPPTHGARCAQYLGFTYYPGGAGIRASSLSRQWRKMRRSIKRTRKVAEANIAAGKADKVYTKKLRRRFSPLQVRNFSSYARRSATAFGQGEKITKQVRRIEREFERLVREIE